MKRKRRASPGDGPTHLRVERDVATGVTARTARPPARRYSNLKMPHERDETTHTPDAPRDVTEQAARDIETGKRDTDCYGATGEHFDGDKQSG
jgi:hypothetical protein